MLQPSQVRCRKQQTTAQKPTHHQPTEKNKVPIPAASRFFGHGRATAGYLWEKNPFFKGYYPLHGRPFPEGTAPDI